MQLRDFPLGFPRDSYSHDNDAIEYCIERYGLFSYVLDLNISSKEINSSKTTSK